MGRFQEYLEVTKDKDIKTTCHMCDYKNANCAYGDLRGTQSCRDNIKEGEKNE